MVNGISDFGRRSYGVRIVIKDIADRFVGSAATTTGATTATTIKTDSNSSTYVGVGYGK